MLRYPVTYLVTLVSMLALDSIWLTLMSAPLYRATIGDALLDGFRTLPAVAFYLVYGLGLMVFVVPRAGQARGLGRVAALGALFGLVAYATYDLSNFATLRNWTLTLSLTDMAWGAVLTSAGSVLGVLAGRAVSRGGAG